MKTYVKTNDLEILTSMLSKHPPTNPNLLLQWEQQTAPREIRTLILQQIEILKGERVFYDWEIYDECQRLLEVLKDARNFVIPNLDGIDVTDTNMIE